MYKLIPVQVEERWRFPTPHLVLGMFLVMCGMWMWYLTRGTGAKSWDLLLSDTARLSDQMMITGLGSQ